MTEAGRTRNGGAPVRLTAGEVAEVTGGTLVGDAAARATGYGTDSRTIGGGDLFFARGEVGHRHVPAAMAAGAAFAVVQDGDALAAGGTGVVVGDVHDALARLAGEVRRRLDVRTVAITGSTGKTTTKDFIAAALASRFRVHAAPNSYNNEVGVPLTILSCPAGAEALVVEIGARHSGEVDALARVAAPHVGIVTGIGVAHIGEFGSREAIAATKSELLGAVPPDGLGIVPSTDEFLDVLSARCPAPLITVGPGGQIRTGPDGAIEASGWRVRVALPAGASQLARNAGMALAAAESLGVPVQQGAPAISAARRSEHRLQVETCGGRTLVNDAYNANPTSLSSALRSVAAMAGTRPAWAVLGEMAELGPIAAREHARIARLARTLAYARVLAVGEHARAYTGAHVEHVPDIDAAAQALAEAPADAVVLVKGSRVVGLERLVARLREAWAEPAGTGGR